MDPALRCLDAAARSQQDWSAQPSAVIGSYPARATRSNQIARFVGPPTLYYATIFHPVFVVASVC